MKNQLNLNIQTPCSEHFNQFKPTAKGGFCNSCEKEVVDFTKMNSEELISYFKTRRTKNTCGRFNSSQLKTYDSNSKRMSLLNVFKSFGLACVAFLSFGTLQAQDARSQNEDSESKSARLILNKNEKDIVIKGHVTESGLPLAGVNVILEGTTIGTYTDFDGNFEFPETLKKGDVLIFSYVGMTSQKLVVDNKHSASNIQLQVDMKLDACIIMGKVAVKDIYTSKKNK
ncbi:carboxypeptidase-like regulatory domain-containing protein [Psychroserpens mesophilus]|uniref:carboxypeptidase-like regulatory domain-containing protein n=1 Tax=Psychroserpens mesophilus TaxID=325473 RepID=UPI003D6596BE